MTSKLVCGDFICKHIIQMNVEQEGMSVLDELIYGTPLAQRASYLPQYSSLFEPDGAVNYDYKNNKKNI